MKKNMSKVVSETDNANFAVLRQNIENFIKMLHEEYDCPGKLMLDVAPQDYGCASKYFIETEIKTLDINPDSGADYIADLCTENQNLIPDEHFDMVLLSEVLEHTLQPFDAIKEVRRIIKKGGYLFLTVPFNFRIHGPLPDCWRFTEYGLRAILGGFEIEALEAKEDENRMLMPIGYTVIAKKT